MSFDNKDKCFLVGCGIFVALILHLIWYIYVTYYKVEPYRSSIDGKSYNIVSAFDGKTHEKAANNLAMINIFINKFIKHLNKKYLSDTNVDPVKIEIVRNIASRYNPSVLKENNPITTKNTSYILNKGDEIAFCLRKKEIPMGIEFQDFNDIQFVVLHELSHLGLDEFGHGRMFWKAFAFLQKEAYEAGLYTPIDYGIPSKEIVYCGVKVQYNPFFDKRLRADKSDGFKV